MVGQEGDLLGKGAEQFGAKWLLGKEVERVLSVASLKLGGAADKLLEVVELGLALDGVFACELSDDATLTEYVCDPLLELGVLLISCGERIDEIDEGGYLVTYASAQTDGVGAVNSSAECIVK